LLAASTVSSDAVMAAQLSDLAGETITSGDVLPLSLDPADLGNILMGSGDGGDDAILVVWNPLAYVRTEMVNIQVPVCAVKVYDADTGAEVTSQVPHPHPHTELLQIPPVCPRASHHNVSACA
jgi:hypothetical protein